MVGLREKASDSQRHESIQDKVTTPIQRLKKAELLKLASGRCKHGHSFLEHRQCYQQAPERIGFLDIEAAGGGFNAEFGIVLSYCIKDGDSDTIFEGALRPKDLRRRDGKEDERIVRQCVTDMRQFDRIVTYYGHDRQYDMPFLRTRAEICGIKFPTYGELKQTDVYPMVKAKLKLVRNRLENACRTVLGSTEKTHVLPHIWRMAGRCDKEALAYVLDHNRKDVTDLEKLYRRLVNYSRRADLSI